MHWKNIWKNEIYQVNEKGEVRNSITNYILSQRKKKTGYKYVKLCTRHHGKKEFLVHRLVAIAFIKPHKLYYQVNHKNKKRLDNRVSNLEWVTAKQNNLHKHNKQYKNY
jgi:hypothetical protein